MPIVAIIFLILYMACIKTFGYKHITLQMFYHSHELSVLTSIEYLFLHSQSTGLDSSEVQTISVPKAIEVKYPVTRNSLENCQCPF